MFWLVFMVALVTDQLTKLIAANYLEINLNNGIAFGWLSKFSGDNISVFLIFLAVAMAYLLRKEWRQNQAVSGLFWAGAISNLLDRVLLGGVIDWISLPYLEIKNNLADFYLSVSLMLLFIKELRSQYGH